MSPLPRIDVTEHEVRLAGLSQEVAGLRIVQLTDFHVGRWFRPDSVATAVSLANERDPDLIVITGDLVGHRSMKHLRAAAEALGELRARLGIYACLGNHDHWEDAGEVRAVLEGIGVRVLVDEGERIAEGLRFVAIDDLMVAPSRLERAAAGVCDREAVVLLSHNPTILPEIAGRPWLVLSGHTHAGQFALPYVGPERTPRLPVLRWFVRGYECVGAALHRGRTAAVSAYRYPAGWFEDGQARMYVCRGLGTAHVCPIRINCPPEIACFTLEPGGEVTRAEAANAPSDEASCRAGRRQRR